MHGIREERDIAGLTARDGRTLVWDLFVRFFHWSLVAAITVAAATGFFAGAPSIDIHAWAGAAAAALIVARITWGFLGSTHARFSDFAAGPRAILAHARALKAGRADRHLGHNPLGGVMIFALMLAVAALSVTGLIVYAGVLKSGPLAFLTSFATGWQAREVHELLAFALIALIGLHVAGAVFESRRTRENLVRAMVDGCKEARPGDHPATARAARPLLAASIAGTLLVATVGAMWSLSGKPGLGVPLAAQDPAYAEECGACHVAYHPSLLPRASWASLMDGLDDHFGENASLDQATGAAIRAYLAANAAEAADTLPANRLRRVDPQEPFAITATPFWKRRHGEIADAVFESKSVGSRGNCEACHADARSGRFYPGAIDIPEETHQ